MLRLLIQKHTQQAKQQHCVHAHLLADVGGQTPFIVLSDDNATTELRTRYAGRVQPEHGLTPAQWDTFVDGVHRIAQSVRDETGLRTVFHPHCAGYIETAARD